MDKIDYRELAFKIFCFGAIGFLCIFFFKYALGYLLPFLLSWGVAYLVYPLANELSMKIKISRKVCSFILIFSFLIIIASIIFLIGNRVLFEIQNLIYSLNNNTGAVSEYLQKIIDLLNELRNSIPFLNDAENEELSGLIKENVNRFVNAIWEGLLSSLGSAVPNLAAQVVTSLPNILLSSLVAIVSCFYFAMDIDLLHIKLKGILPPKIVDVLRGVKRKLGIGFKKYIKAYVLIFLLTFCELLVGFLMLKIDYAFVLALVIAFVDFLPVLGTGAILLPWGIILILMNNISMGVGILILFVVTTVVRQIAEPKIVGDSLGVHPLITLAAIYLGYRILGIWGMILAPLVALLLLSKEAQA